ncbi:MAG: phosphate ABC transporter permease subunit PstC [Alphaproteobacteria bacterium]
MDAQYILIFFAIISATVCYLGLRQISTHESISVYIQLGWQKRFPNTKLRHVTDPIVKLCLFSCALFTIILTFAIAAVLIIETIHFFQFVSVPDFLFGLRWSPSKGDGFFGFLPLLMGTLLVTGIAMLIAIPIGIYAALYTSQYMSKSNRSIVKPIMEVLAGIPTVVFGFIALIVVSPLIQKIGTLIGLSVASESALGVGIVIGIMVIPYITSLSDDVITAVPKALRDSSLAMGATMSESVKKVVLPAAMPGVTAAVLLAMSRAIGETMIVVMAAGYSANLTANPLESVTTVTVQIVSQLTGDQEFNSSKTLVAFALGLALFIITFIINFLALRVVNKYREKYA